MDDGYSYFISRAKDLGASFIDKAGKSHGYTLGDFINVTGVAAKNKISADSFTYSGILSNYTLCQLVYSRFNCCNRWYGTL